MELVSTVNSALEYNGLDNNGL